MHESIVENLKLDECEANSKVKDGAAGGLGKRFIFLHLEINKQLRTDLDKVMFTHMTVRSIQLLMKTLSNG